MRINVHRFFLRIIIQKFWLTKEGQCLHRCCPSLLDKFMKVEEKYKLNQGYFSPVTSSSAIRT